MRLTKNLRKYLAWVWIPATLGLAWNSLRTTPDAQLALGVLSCIALTIYAVWSSWVILAEEEWPEPLPPPYGAPP